MGYFSAVRFSAIDKLNGVLLCGAMVLINVADREGFVVSQPMIASILLSLSFLFVFFAFLGMILLPCLQLATEKPAQWMWNWFHGSKVCTLLVISIAMLLAQLTDKQLSSVKAGEFVILATRTMCSAGGSVKPHMTRTAAEYKGHYCYSSQNDERGRYVDIKVDKAFEQSAIALNDQASIQVEQYPSSLFEGAYEMIKTIAKK